MNQPAVTVVHPHHTSDSGGSFKGLREWISERTRPGRSRSSVVEAVQPGSALGTNNQHSPAERHHLSCQLVASCQSAREDHGTDPVSQLPAYTWRQLYGYHNAQLAVTTRRHFLDPTVDEAQTAALYLAVTFGTQISEVSYDIPAVIRRYCSVLRQRFPAGMNLCLGLPAGSPCPKNGGCNTTIERLMLSLRPASGGGHDELSLPLVSLMLVRQPDCTCVCPYLPQRQPSQDPILATACYLSILYLFFDTPRFPSRRSRIPVNPIHHDLPL